MPGLRVTSPKDPRGQWDVAVATDDGPASLTRLNRLSPRWMLPAGSEAAGFGSGVVDLGDPAVAARGIIAAATARVDYGILRRRWLRFAAVEPTPSEPGLRRAARLVSSVPGLGRVARVLRRRFRPSDF
jgi:hypothetical protein